MSPKYCFFNPSKSVALTLAFVIPHLLTRPILPSSVKGCVKKRTVSKLSSYEVNTPTAVLMYLQHCYFPVVILEIAVLLPLGGLQLIHRPAGKFSTG